MPRLPRCVCSARTWASHPRSISGGWAKPQEAEEPRLARLFPYSVLVRRRTIMSNLNSEHVTMRIACPECKGQMFLHVGLTPDTTNQALECPHCLNMFVPLVPGRVLRGPFQVPDWPGFLHS